MKRLMTLPHAPRWPGEKKVKQGRREKGGEDKSGNGKKLRFIGIWRTDDNFYY